MIAIQNELTEHETTCRIGILAMEHVGNTSDRILKIRKRELEEALRERYGGMPRSELKALPPMDAYVAYYKRFGYTYHVLPQLESVARGKAIPEGLPLVEAMFMAELKNMLLTAGHDLDRIRAPLKFTVSAGREDYTDLGGKAVTAISGDILIADGESVLSSILRGPDQRTAITERTSRVLYTVYAPAGVEEGLVMRHLGDMEGYVRIFSEESVTCLKQVF